VTDLATLSDRELADAVTASGAEWAFRELYRRHAPRMFLLIHRLVGSSRTDAEDIHQDTWLAVVKGLPAFRWDAALSTWLVGVAVNQTRSFWRRRGDRVFLSLEDHALSTQPAPTLERLDLDGAIAHLPPGQRAVVVLHDLEGFTHDEVAERLRVSAGTSKSQLFAARQSLRRLLHAPTPTTTDTRGPTCVPCLKTT